MVTESDMDISDTETRPTNLEEGQLSTNNIMGETIYSGVVPTTIPGIDGLHVYHLVTIRKPNPTDDESLIPTKPNSDAEVEVTGQLIRSSNQVHPPTDGYQHLLDLPVEGNKNYALPFTTLKTSVQIKERLALINTFAQFDIDEDTQHRLAALWCLLMDPNHTAAIALTARSIYNYHCGDLIETFGNLVSL